MNGLRQSCLQMHIKTGETELLSHAMTLVATQVWEHTESPSFAHPALEAVCERFSLPLEHAGVDISLVLEDMYITCIRCIVPFSPPTSRQTDRHETDTTNYLILQCPCMLWSNSMVVRYVLKAGVRL